MRQDLFITVQQCPVNTGKLLFALRLEDLDAVFHQIYFIFDLFFPRQILLLFSPGGHFLLPDLRLEPVTADIAQLAGTLEASLPGDPADRIIVATAIELKAKLVTADDRLRLSPRVETVW